jgi:signal transduction protein with GAF and PtsI domain
MEETIQISASEAAQLESLLDENLPVLKQLLKEIEEHHREIDRLEAETEALRSQIQRYLLHWELENQKKQSALERENLRLQVENMLLRHQRALPTEGKEPGSE